uniref:Uncharacterized protein n=1 Tax=Pristionchus pacificus TaxID=54126 RepID=A0A8R1YTL5_PRIPA
MSKDTRGESNDCVRDRSTYYEETTHEGHSCCGSMDCSFRSIMCGQMGHLTRMCKQQTAFIIRSSFGAHVANTNGKDHTVEKVVGKDHTVEKVIAEVDCETEGFRDHNAPAVIENVIVKVECEAGSARDHNAPEAKVKFRGYETNYSGYTEIFLQDRYSDNVRVAPENTLAGKSSRMEKKAKFKPISERDNPIQCDHLSYRCED